MMIDYVATFSVMNSFMTLGDAIAWVVVLSILSISGITFFIVFLIQVIKMKLKNSKTKKDCISSKFHEVKKADVNGIKYNRKPMLIMMSISEIMFLIFTFFSFEFQSLWVFSICFGCLFICTFIVGVIQQFSWNKRYRKLLEEINELELKIKFNEKKLAALDE